MVLGSDETIALSHAQKLLSLVYYAGPDLLVNYLQSPVSTDVHNFLFPENVLFIFCSVLGPSYLCF